MTDNNLNNETNEQQEPIDPGQIRKATQRSLLKGLSNVMGTEIQSIEELYALAAQMKKEPVSQTVKNSQETVDNGGNTGRTSTKELADQIKAMQDAMAKKDQALAQERLENQITRSIGDRFDPDLTDAALMKIKSQIQTNDGQITVVNKNGTQRYNDNGQPMTIDELVNEVAKNNPKLLRQRQSSNNSGSGIRSVDQFGTEQFGDDNVPDYSVDPAGFKRWAAAQGLHGDKKSSALAGIKLKMTNYNK